MKSIRYNIINTPSGTIHYDHNHLVDAYVLRYALDVLHIKPPVQKSYACECQRCGLTRYTSYKRLSCEFCGCDSNQFTCRELE